jgi:hypothetical protein
MRHIDDLRFEIEALKVHALRSNNESLSASADFMTDTLNSLEQSLNERDEDGAKEFIINDRTGDMFTRCDYCSKLHNELELTDVTHTITIAGEQSKRYSLICKPCEGKQ